MLFAFPLLKKAKSDCNQSQLFEKSNFPIGVAVNIDKLKYDATYKALALLNEWLNEGKQVYAYFTIQWVKHLII